MEFDGIEKVGTLTRQFHTRHLLLSVGLGRGQCEDIISVVHFLIVQSVKCTKCFVQKLPKFMAYVEIISLESSLQNKCRPDRGRKTQPFRTVIHILECELDPHKAEDWG